MSSKDDWFGEEATEAPQRRRLLLPDRPNTPDARRPRPGRDAWRQVSMSRLRATWRLLAVVVVFVFVVVAIASLAGGENVGAADRAYLSSLAGPATDSEAVGAQLSALLSRPTLAAATLNSSLSALILRQEHDTALASTINPAPRFRSLQLSALDALRFRDSGLTGLLTAFRDAESNPTKAGWATALAAQASRLTTSDVVWHDLFQSPAQAQLRHDGVLAATVPESTFLTNPGLATDASMAAVLSKLANIAQPATGTPALLKLTDTGSAVEAWQTELNKWLATQQGATLLTVDGQFGQSTMAATEQFQNAAGVSADGVVGPVTRSALSKALGA